MFLTPLVLFLYIGIYSSPSVGFASDINECKERSACRCDGCSCKNTWGAYECKCKGDLLYIREQDACIGKLMNSSYDSVWQRIPVAFIYLSRLIPLTCTCGYFLLYIKLTTMESLNLRLRFSLAKNHLNAFDTEFCGHFEEEMLSA